jgi:hypothetical protein
MITNKLLSPTQIGFMKGKRTSDHLFVLKCIIEDAKRKHKPIYACFVDLKKAFDTVWREGLYYKLLYDYKLSSKFVNITRSIYSNIKGAVKLNGGLISNHFTIGIGLRQGCNLSPYLFDLYIDDLSKILDEADIDPVCLMNTNISSLFYADDMLILSNSEAGLQKALDIIAVYCNRWQLVLNPDKSKIVIFNSKLCDSNIEYLHEKLEVVSEYSYLGLKIHKSGSFTAAIKDLQMKAQRAYCKLKYTFKCNNSPQLFTKLFDVLVKPILLYAAEVWGGFGHRKKSNLPLLSNMLNKVSAPYEKLHLNMCKECLGVPKRSSNMCCMGELGRYPLAKDIVISVLKFASRLKCIGDNDLLNLALSSQENSNSNSQNTYTYSQFSRIIHQQLGLEYMVYPPIDSILLKYKLKAFGKNASNLCDSYFSDIIFKPYMALKRSNVLDKHFLYSQLKQGYSYETYLNVPGSRYINEVTRFRLSVHWLPIERGRYTKPVTPRDRRICNFCKASVGDEFHVLMQCTSKILSSLRHKFLSVIHQVSPSLQYMDKLQQFYLLMKCHVPTVIPLFAEWVHACNNLFKP